MAYLTGQTSGVLNAILARLHEVMLLTNLFLLTAQITLISLSEAHTHIHSGLQTSHDRLTCCLQFGSLHRIVGTCVLASCTYEANTK